MFLVSKFYINLSRNNIREPRERYVQYYNDLYDLEKDIPPNKNSYLKGDQYSYSELGDILLNKCRETFSLETIDMIVFCYWSHEFDPDHSYGAYLCHKYKIKSIFFDICDQGVLSSITAMRIISSYFNLGLIKNALLIAFDQTSIPFNINYQGAFPTNSSAIAMLFQKEKNSKSIYKIVNSDIVLEKDLNFWKEKNKKIKLEEISYSKKLKNTYSCPEILSFIFDNEKISFNQSDQCFLIHASETNEKGFICIRNVVT